MAASTTSSFTTQASAAVLRAPARAIGGKRRRRISPEAGHALEILGHAIDYLSDEYVHSGGALTDRDPQVQAVQLLMAINRQVYFSCPEIPSMRDRFLAFFRRHIP
jgi:hypothetical protein